MKATQYEKSVAALLDLLPQRTNEVLERRYGLRGGDAETLEQIGQDFGVTRERVRQIEASGLNQVRREASDIVEGIFRDLVRHMQAHGGLRAEHHLFDDFVDSVRPEAMRFLLDLGEPFSRHRETERRYAVWVTDQERLREAEAFERGLVRSLEEVGRQLEEAAFWQLVEEEARRQRLSLTARARNSWVGVSRNILEGPLKTWGLRSWPEIAPRNVGDWAFIVLRAEEKPLHFTDIVNGMNEMRDSSAQEDGGRAARPAHLQTVHNELIKDDRFVLVGRGIYALREWGYEPGTVSDVIARILEEAKRPLPREEIVAKVASVRHVQPNTILLNLQNKQVFSRTSDGRYALLKA